MDRFVTWIARARAYNGSDVDGGQEAYDRGFNTLLARWAHEYRTDLDSTGLDSTGLDSTGLDSTGKGGGRS